VEAGQVVRGDLIELPISHRTYPVGRVSRYPDGTVALFWRERPGKRWGDGEEGGVMHKAADTRVVVHR
jgi:hypothetical protein